MQVGCVDEPKTGRSLPWNFGLQRECNMTILTEMVNIVCSTKSGRYPPTQSCVGAKQTGRRSHGTSRYCAEWYSLFV